MKKFFSPFTIALLACPLIALGQSNLTSDPAYLPIDKAFDLKAVPPQVNINLPRFLLKDVAPELNSVLKSRDKDKGIDFGELIKDVKLIRVVVLEANSSNRSAVEKGVKQLRKELEAKWTAIVSVPEENVGVYAMGDPAGESMTGIAVLVVNKDEAVVANVVGHVSIGKLIKLASQMDKVPKDLLKKLQSVGGQPDAQSGSNGTGSGKKPAESSDDTPKKDKAE